MTWANLMPFFQRGCAPGGTRNDIFGTFFCADFVCWYREQFGGAQDESLYEYEFQKLRDRDVVLCNVIQRYINVV